MLSGSVLGGVIAIPFMLLSRGQHSPADTARDVGEDTQS
jgi:ABC-type phosphate/phosphonate transport system permease subunit